MEEEKMKKFAILLGAAALLPLGAHAAGCAAPRNAFDQVYCTGNLFSQADHELNQEYSRLRSHLNASQQAALKSGQIAWIKQRYQSCSEEKQSGYFVNLTCAVDTTQQRLAFLKERERECNSTGCVDAKLGQ
jgi:uncharacterized protein YecT (DUF1311 family)